MRKICRISLRGAALLAAASLLAACAGPQRRSTAGIDHVVLVWLKQPGNPDDAARLVAASKDLAARIPQVRHLTWGRPAPSDRPIADDSFDLALIMEFGSKGDLEAYGNNPDHIRAAKNVLRPLARRVIVYDIQRD